MAGRGRKTLPMPNEGNNPPQDKKSPEYAGDLRKAQEEVGKLMWVSLKTRPDISASVSIAATMMSKNPKDAVAITDEIWRYLGATWFFSIGHGWS